MRLLFPDTIREIASKIYSSQRITPEEGVFLFREAGLGMLGMMADHIREVKNGNRISYIRNFHVEPTNVCVNKCRFCSYSHHYSDERWEMTVDEILDRVREQDDDVSELHVTGAVHPDRDIFYYGDLLKRIHKVRPEMHLKAYSAVELDYMIRKSGMTISEGLTYLKSCGLGSIPGGGAEIFDEAIRSRICGMKSSSATWIEIHETAHRLGIPSNATILYGHIESIGHRIDHLERLRQLQDRTGGFNAFIPLKFRSSNHEMSYIPEVPVVEDLKMYAIARIYLDNFPHIKAYWPAIGKSLAQLTLSFGVDDMDGTINDSTRIYSMAGAEEQNPAFTVSEMQDFIRKAGKAPVERDSWYTIIAE
jgi:aminodeoxyfutalosine synthase